MVKFSDLEKCILQVCANWPRKLYQKNQWKLWEGSRFIKYDTVVHKHHDSKKLDLQVRPAEVLQIHMCLELDTESHYFIEGPKNFKIKLSDVENWIIDVDITWLINNWLNHNLI